MTSKAQHTPGPWRIVTADTSLVIVAHDGMPITAISNADDEDRANYTLMSAAPDLLAALEKIVAMNRQHALDQYGNADKAETWACVTTARAAISKARGE